MPIKSSNIDFCLDNVTQGANTNLNSALSVNLAHHYCISHSPQSIHISRLTSNVAVRTNRSYFETGFPLVEL